MSFRFIYMGIGSLLVMLLLLISDPDVQFIQNLPIGGGTLAILISLVVSVLWVAMLHISRKGLLDYLNLQEYFEKAKLTPEGSGMAIIGVGIIMLSISVVILAATK